MSFDKKSPLLLKICEPATSHKKYPLPEPFPNRPSNPTPIPLTYHSVTLPTTPLFPPPWNSPTKGERKFWGIKEEKDEKNVLENLFLESTTLLAKLVEKILYKQMSKLLKEDLKSFLLRK